MPLNKLTRKARLGLKVLRNEGILSFQIKLLQKLQSRVGKNRHHRAVHNIYTKAEFDDVLRADFTAKRKPWGGTTKKQLTFNWLMPPPGKGSGGHMTLFRFIQALEKAGHTCRIYLYAQDGNGPISAVHAAMGDSFPHLDATQSMQWLKKGEKMLPADGVFATSWETAYPIFNAQADAKHFYFVQDFEPYFYPHGSFYALAENTYRFGFFGITAGGWLSKKLHEDYGMATDHIDFGADQTVYKYENDTKRKEVFAYVRPTTERRGFEMAILTMKAFHDEHPDYIIHFFGWDVSAFKMPFPYQNHKTLEITELNELYNRCAAGLVLSFTNMSLLPLELLACGTIPVVNVGENNSLVCGNKHIVYAEANPVALAKAMSKAVTRKDVVAEARRAAASVPADSWETSKQHFVKVIEKQTRAHE